MKILLLIKISSDPCLSTAGLELYAARVTVVCLSADGSVMNSDLPSFTLVTFTAFYYSFLPKESLTQNLLILSFTSLLLNRRVSWTSTCLGNFFIRNSPVLCRLLLIHFFRPFITFFKLCLCLRHLGFPLSPQNSSVRCLTSAICLLAHLRCCEHMSRESRSNFHSLRRKTSLAISCGYQTINWYHTKPCIAFLLQNLRSTNLKLFFDPLTRVPFLLH